MGPLLFIIVFNENTVVIKDAKIVKFAHDTVIFVADWDVTVIETKLTKDMNSIADWFDESGLEINLKKARMNLAFVVHHKELQNRVSHLILCTEVLR